MLIPLRASFSRFSSIDLLSFFRPFYFDRVFFSILFLKWIFLGCSSAWVWPLASAWSSPFVSLANLFSKSYSFFLSTRYFFLSSLSLMSCSLKPYDVVFLSIVPFSRWELAPPLAFPVCADWAYAVPCCWAFFFMRLTSVMMLWPPASLTVFSKPRPTPRTLSSSASTLCWIAVPEVRSCRRSASPLWVF